MLEQLRAATSTLHKEVEQLVGADKMQDGTFSVQDYINYLLASYRFHSNIEEILLPHAAAIPFGNERIKTPSIKQDLLKFNINVEDYQQQLRENSLAATLGYLYVSEGSMLGAQIIYKSLLNIPHIKDLDAFHFLTVYSKRTGPLWSSLVQTLQADGKSAEEQKTIVASAKEAFVLFGKIHQEQLAVG